MATDKYLQTLGGVIYTYLGLQYGITSLGNKLAPGLVFAKDIAVLGSVAHDFEILSWTGDYPVLKPIVSRFKEVTKTFLGLLQTTPFTASDGEQCLGSSELNTQWTLDVLQEFAETVTKLQTEVDALLQTFNPK